MMRLLRNSRLSLLVILISLSLTQPVGAFSFSLNSVSFLQKTADLIIGRVSDIIYYLIMQKRYVFNNFIDPNVYLSLSVSTNDPILSSVTVPTTKEVVSNKLIAITTSTPPSIKKTDSVITRTQGQITSSTPVLIVESNSVSNPAIEFTLNNSNNSQILTLTNNERENMSLNPLLANKILDTIADLRADDLFANQYFEHDSPDNQSASDLAKKFGYDYLLIGENLALGHFDGDQGIVSAWLASPGHRANILNEKYTELGVAVKEGMFKGENTTIAVQIFGTPLANCPKPNFATKDLIDSLTVSIKQKQTEALVMYNNLTTIKNNPNLDRSYYNQKIQEYNYFAKQVNDAVIALKGLIDIYNITVNKYNTCINS